MERREVVRGGVLSVIINNFKEGVRHTLADENGDRVIDEASDSCTTQSLADLPSRTGDGHGHLESSVDVSDIAAHTFVSSSTIMC